jgi:hypothetical protein
MTKMQESATTEIDSDLLEAKKVIRIQQTSVDAELLKTKFQQLIQLPKLNSAEKLLLLTCALNLMLYAHQTQASADEIEYHYNISIYNTLFFKQAQLPLTALQKAQWSAVIADAHKMTGYHEDPIKYYVQAIQFVKEATQGIKEKYSKEQRSLIKMQLNYYVKIIDICADNVTHYETTEKAPDLAAESNQKMIEAIDSALRRKPDESLKIKLTAMRKSAAEKLAAHNAKTPFWQNSKKIQSQPDMGYNPTKNFKS